LSDLSSSGDEAGMSDIDEEIATITPESRSDAREREAALKKERRKTLGIEAAALFDLEPRLVAPPGLDKWLYNMNWPEDYLGEFKGKMIKVIGSRTIRRMQEERERAALQAANGRRIPRKTI